MNPADNEYEWIQEKRRRRAAGLSLEGMPPRPAKAERPPPKLPPPTKMQIARNAAAAVRSVVANRGRRVSDEQYERNLAICAQCEYWDPTGFAGSGRCSHPKCGCSKLKQRLVGQHCPLDPPKWDNRTNKET